LKDVKAVRNKPDSLSILNYCICNTLPFGKNKEETIEDQQKWTERLLWDANKGRICDYCGINIDIPWLDILMFFHEDCWKQYRKDGKPYPLPKYA
jgi:hypothetical protein